MRSQDTETIDGTISLDGTASEEIKEASRIILLDQRPERKESHGQAFRPPRKLPTRRPDAQAAVPVL